MTKEEEEILVPKILGEMTDCRAQRRNTEEASRGCFVGKKETQKT